jgi:type IV pilus assembly protein PilV
MRSASYPRHGASGFTMLEVLISIVVIAFGLLGVAGLQAFAIKNNQGASLRSTATVLASDIIDRMKANPLGATAGNYGSASGPGTAAQAANCLTSAGCATALELAQHDLFEWAALLAAALPAGTGVVCLDSTPNDGTSAAGPACDNIGTQYVVKIWWIDDRNRNAATNAPATLFATEFQI